MKPDKHFDAEGVWAPTPPDDITTDKDIDEWRKTMRHYAQASCATMTEMLVNRGGMKPRDALQLISNVAHDLKGAVAYGFAGPSVIPTETTEEN